MNIDAVTATLLGTLVGAVAGIAGSVVVAIIAKRSDEKKHLRQLVFDAGEKMWALHVDIAKKTAEAGRTGKVDPLEAYILNALVFSKIIEDGDLDRETVLKKWREQDSIAQAIHSEIRTREKAANQAREATATAVMSAAEQPPRRP
jgi:hypothetical protein